MNILNIHSGTDIQATWQAVLEETTAYFEAVPNEEFVKSQGEKWSIAENLDHLFLSVKAITGGLKMPKIALRAIGKPNRPSRTYEGLVKRYHQKLEVANPSSNPYSSKAVKSQAELVNDWQSIGQKFYDRVGQWSEKDLESYLMPHPLLGKLTIREMLMFNIYHTLHHLEICKKYYKR